MNNVKVDASLVDKFFNILTDLEQIKILRLALNKATSLLKRETKKNLQNIGLSNITKINPKYNTSLLKGIKKYVSSDGLEAKVHIMGDFRLKFFEKGTKERVNKKGSYRGFIKPYNFFSRSYESTKQLMDSIILETLTKRINELK